MNGRQFVAGTLSTILLICNPFVAYAGLVIGTFDSTRASIGNIATGNFSQSVRDGIESQYPGTSYVTFPAITSSALTGVDILLISTDKNDVDPIDGLSPSEQSAMLNFVEAGGRALIMADGWGKHVAAAQSMTSPFGLTLADDGHTGLQGASTVNTPNPIIDGPFGTVPSILLYGAGMFTNLGTHATAFADEISTGEPIAAYIASGALGPDSGRVVLYTDSQMFIDQAASGFYPLHEVLFANTMNYLAPVPEPSSLLLAALGLRSFVAFAYRQSKRPVPAQSGR